MMGVMKKSTCNKLVMIGCRSRKRVPRRPEQWRGPDSLQKKQN